MIDLLLPSGQTLPTENTKFKTESSKFECKSYNFLPPESMHPLSIYTNSGQGQNNWPTPLFFSIPPCGCPAFNPASGRGQIKLEY